ncbi:carbohydrate ABC transporter permease [Sediminispirochaeta smaragdinae]|nr:sugar ABC transporter permease [Sediminispirochaeta smaragdinae]
MVYSVGITFYQWNLLRADLGMRFTGLSNYIQLLSDPFTWEVVGRTLLFVVGAVGLELVLGCMIALFLNTDFFGAKLLQSIVLLPFMIAPIVVGFTWRFLLSNSVGPVPPLLTSLGLGGLVSPPLLANRHLVMVVFIVVDVWQYTPFVVLVLLAGLKSLPTEPYDAAQMDGATPMQRFFLLTVPLLKPSILVAVVIRTLTAFRIFDRVMIMTGGGPGSASEVLSFYGYRTAFQSYEMGMAGAIGILTLAIAMVFTVFYIKQVGLGDS